VVEAVVYNTVPTLMFTDRLPSRKRTNKMDRLLNDENSFTLRLIFKVETHPIEN